MEKESKDKKFPTLIVLDCDMCLWTPEMYTLESLPKHPIFGALSPGMHGVVGAKNDEGEVVKLFAGALQILQDFALNRFPPQT